MKPRTRETKKLLTKRKYARNKTKKYGRKRYTRRNKSMKGLMKGG